ncbi:amidohydrolase [Lacticaseibacillus paracasei]|uniref:amidohydrolase n=1 Tax=Lacticaseibacillus paracasei TaxID=1597 RepID=UPI00403F0E32
MSNLIDPNLNRQLIAWRHDFHQHPELANQEERTSQKIRDILSNWHIQLRPTQLSTGVFADIGHGIGPTVALRADIDALPIQENSGEPFTSENPGVMHACGHDTHIASLLGGAYLLKQKEDQLPGNVRLIFQRSEEDKEGALQVLADHQLDGVDAIIGFHNAPFHPVGTFGVHAGISSGAIDKFKVTLTGLGTHASAPQNGIDPVAALGTEITSLQTIVSRNIAPVKAGVLSITHISAGSTWNVLPETAFFEGTVRTADKDVRALIKQRFFPLVEQTAAAQGVNADIDWYDGDPSVDNDPRLTAIVQDESGKFAESFTDELGLGSDDFACFQEHVPGVYARLGNGFNISAHNPRFRADDGVISVGARFFYQNAIRLLKEL